MQYGRVPSSMTLSGKPVKVELCKAAYNISVGSTLSATCIFWMNVNMVTLMEIAGDFGFG